jgi:hypothetical protein
MTDQFATILNSLSTLSESELRTLNHSVCDQLKSVRDQESARNRRLFSAGDKVSFNGRRGYTEGTIVRVKRKKAIVKVDGDYRNWDVPLNMLSAA